MANEATRWVIALLALLCVISLLLWGRGVDHQRGDEVGAFGISRTLAGP